MTIVVSVVAGIVVGAVLARRNARRSHADELLADALNDLVSAIADVAGGDADAQRRYASATSRIALHGSPELVEAFRAFQRNANTGTDDGRRRLIAALQAGREELGRRRVDDDAARVLLFGADDARDRPAR